MIIRKAAIGESQHVLAFYHELIELMRGVPYRPSWEIDVYPTYEDLVEPIQREELYLAEDEGRIVGAFILNHLQGEGYRQATWKTEVPDEQVAVVHLLAVHPEIQGKGIGSKLLDKIVELSRASGDRVIRLDTLPRNQAGRGLYENFGFVDCGEITLTYPTTGTMTFCVYEYQL